MNGIFDNIRNYLFFLFVLFVVTACGGGGGGTQYSPISDSSSSSVTEVTTWSDEFTPASVSSSNSTNHTTNVYQTHNFALDTSSKWNIDVGGQYVNNTGTVVVTQDSSNSSNYLLNIVASCADGSCNSITSGKVTTKDKFDFKHGRVEARIQIPNNQYVWPSFSLVGASSTAEVSIMEAWQASGNTDRVNFALNNGSTKTYFTKSLNYSLDNDFHVYSVEWDENAIVGKIDGVEITSQATTTEFNQNFYIALGVAVGGAVTPTTIIATPTSQATLGTPTMLVDWVRVYPVETKNNTGLLGDDNNSAVAVSTIEASSPETGGNEVSVTTSSTEIPALKGDSSMKIDFKTNTNSTSKAAIKYNATDLSKKTDLNFALNASSAPNLDSVDVVVSDTTNAALVSTSGYTPTVVSAGGTANNSRNSAQNGYSTNQYTTSSITTGDSSTWNTYSIPTNAFTGIDFSQFTGFGFSNPKDSGGNLVTGALYVDNVQMGENVGIKLPLDFEISSSSYSLSDANGAGIAIVDNPGTSNINGSDKVAMITKHGHTDGSVSILLDEAIDFSSKKAFTLKVHSTREVPVELTLADPDNPSDSASIITNYATEEGKTWQKLGFDFEENVPSLGNNITKVTIKFDNGVIGDFKNNPDSWRFYIDELEQHLEIPLDAIPVPNDVPLAPIATRTISVYSNDHIDINRNLNPSLGQSTSLTEKQYASNDVLELVDFDFQIIDFTDDKQDFTAYDKVHFNYWTNDVSSFRASLVSINNGTTIEGAYTITATTKTAWASVDIDSSTFSNAGVDLRNIAQIKFDTTANDNGTVYLDNILAYDSSTQEGGLVKNGTFSQGSNYWRGNHGGLEILSDGDNNYFYADPTSAGDSWAVNLEQAITFDADKTYTLGFKAKSEDSRAITAGIGINFGSYTNDSVTVNLTPSWQDYTYILSSNGFGSTNSRVFFEFGSAIGDVSLDDISLIVGGTTTGTTTSTSTVALPVNFEQDTSTYSVTGFDGGSISVQANPQSNGINTSAQVAEIIKGSGQTYAGSFITLDTPVDFDNGKIFKVKAWSSQPRDLLFQFSNSEGQPGYPNQIQTTMSHSGGSQWQELTYDLSDLDFTPFDSNGGAVRVAFIMDNGTNGDGSADWTMYVDDIIQETSGASTVTTPTDAAPTPTADAADVISIYSDAYTDITNAWNNAGAWGATNIAPTDDTIASNAVKKVSFDSSGGQFIATSFTGNPIDGSVYTHFHLDFWTTDANLTNKVFNLKLSNHENGSSETNALEYAINTGTTPAIESGKWVSVDIPIANFANNQDGTYGIGHLAQFVITSSLSDVYVDNIYLYKAAAGTTTSTSTVALPVNFEQDTSTYSVTGFDGGSISVQANPQSNGINTSAQVAEIIKGSGQTYAGSFITLDTPVDFDNGKIFKVKAWSSQPRDLLFQFSNSEGQPGYPNQIQTTMSHSGGSQWQELTYDLSDLDFTPFDSNGGAVRVAFIMDNGTNGDGSADWTMYVDDIIQETSGASTVTTPTDAAPTPTADAADVISIYSDAYTDITNAWNNAGAWGATNIAPTDDTIASNAVKKVSFDSSGGQFIATSFTGNPIDGSVYTHFHLDFWTTDANLTNKVFNLKLSNHENGSSETNALEYAINTGTTPAIESGKWVSVDIPIANFANNQDGTYGIGHLAQFVITSSLSDVYVDNIYLYKAAAGTTTSTSTVALPVNFEQDTSTYSVTGFDGGSISVQANPQSNGINTSAQVAEIIKGSGQTYAGSFITLDTPVDFDNGKIFKVKAWSSQPRDLLFQFSNSEGQPGYPNQIQTTMSHSGGSQWQELTYDLSDLDFTPFDSNGGAVRVAFIMDNGTNGDGSADWTMYVDDIIQETSGASTVTTPTDAAPTPTADAADVISIYSDAYTDITNAWNNAGAWGATNIAPTDDTIASNAVKKVSFDSSGGQFIATSFTGNPIDGSVYTHFHLDFWTTDANLTNKVFNLKLSNHENGSSETNALEYAINTGTTPAIESGKWVSVDIPIANFANNQDGTYGIGHLAQFVITSSLSDVYVDNIYLYKAAAGTTTSTSTVALPVNFEQDTSTYSVTGFDGGSISVQANPQSNGINTSAQVAEIIKGSGQTYAGSFITLDTPVDFDNGKIFKVKAWSSQPRDLLFQFSNSEGQPGYPNQIQTTMSHSGGSQWQELTYDLSDLDFTPFDSNGGAVRVAFIMDNGTNGDGSADWTMYVDDIIQETSGASTVTTPTDAAPTPTADAADVISIYSDAYTDITNAWNNAGAWGATNIAPTDDTIASNAVKKVSFDSSGGQFIATSFTGNPIDGSVYTHFHLDFWTTDANLTNKVFNLKLSNHENGSSETNALEYAINTGTTPAIESGKWVSVDIPIANFANNQDGTYGIGHLAQFVITSSLSDVYVDNIYLYKAAAGTTTSTSTVALPVNFEQDTSTYSVTGFDGGSISVQANPQSNGINTSAQVAEIIKGSGQTYAGSFITLDTPVDFDNGKIFKVKAWSSQPRDLLFQFSNSEGQPGYPNQIQTTMSHSGGSQWQELTYDLSDLDFTPFDSNGGAVRVAFIMDNGTNGDGSADWTMYVDDIIQETSGASTVTTPTDAAPTPTADAADVISIYSDAYTDITNAWNNAGAWGATNIAPTDDTIASNAVKKVSFDSSGGQFIATSFTGNPIDGSVYTHFHLDFWTTDANLTNKVFNLKLSNHENGSSETNALEYAINTGTTPAIESGKWVSVDIPIANFANNQDGTYGIGHLAQFVITSSLSDVYVDNIYLYKAAAGTTTSTSTVALPVNFEQDTSTYSVTGFDGGSISVQANPQSNGINTSAQVAEIIKGSGQTYAGSFITLDTPVDFDNGKIFKVKAWSSQPRDLLFQFSNSEGQPGYPNQIQTTMSHSGGSQWQELTYDLSDLDFTPFDSNGGAVRVAFIMDNGTNGDGSADWTMYVDDIIQETSGASTVTTPTDAAPTPTADAADVISIYSDAYTDITNAWNNAGAWGATNIAPTDDTIASNAVKKVSFDSSGGQFIATSFTGNPIDGSVYTHFHLDFWTTDANLTNKVFNLKLSNHENGSSETNALEYAINTGTTPAIESGKWVSVDIPIANFANNQDGTYGIGHLAQFVITSSLSDVYVDNIYLYKAAAGTTTSTSTVALPVNFEQDTSTYSVTGFDGGSISVQANPQSNGINTSAQVAEIIKGSGQTYAGSFITLDTPVDFDNGKIFKVKAWSSQPRDLLFQFSNSEGQPGYPNQIQTTMSHSGGSQWQELTYDLSDLDFTPFDSNGGAVRVAFIMDNGTNGDGSADWTMYVDDIIQETSGASTVTTPTDAAPTPTADAADVISIYSDAYTDITNAWNNAGAWGATNIAPTDDTIASNAVKKVSFDSSGGQFIATSFTGNPIDGSVYTHFHLDFWTTDANLTNKVFNLKLSNHENGSSETNALEYAINTGTTPAIESGKWVSVDIPIANFANNQDGTYGIGHLAQFVITSSLSDVYVDNIYLYKAAAGTTTSTSTVALPVNFEQDTSTYSVTGFDGGSISVQANPQSNGINTSAQVAEIIKGSGQTYAGSFITLDTPVDFDNGKIFKVKAWSSQPRDLLFQFSNSEGQPGYPNQIQTTMSHSGGSQWQELTYDLSDLDFTPFDSNGGAVRVAFIMDNGTNGDGSADWTMYVDDIIQETSGASTVTTPTDAAPTPTADAADVISIYSDAYTDVELSGFPTSWSTATLAEETIADNKVQKLTGGFIGVEPTAGIDGTNHTHMHIDVWVESGTSILFKVRDYGPNGSYDGGDDAEIQYTHTLAGTDAWESVEIPLTNATKASLSQIVIDAQSAGDLMYFDNVYFYTADTTSTFTTLLWSDEFNNSTVNTSNWNYETGYGLNDSGWGNDERQNYTSDAANISIQDDPNDANNKFLKITAICSDDNCGVRDGSVTSARINTKDNFTFKYGRVEARIKVPSGDSTWPAFWMLGDTFNPTTYQGWPEAGEIDIMEISGADTVNKSIFAMHWDDNGHTWEDARKDNGSPLSNDFHVYSMEWDSTKVRGFLDGAQFFEQDITSAAMTEFHQDFFFILNIAIDGTLGGTPNQIKNTPQEMLVDWVRVYQ